MVTTGDKHQQLLLEQIFCRTLTLDRDLHSLDLHTPERESSSALFFSFIYILFSDNQKSLPTTMATKHFQHRTSEL